MNFSENHRNTSRFDAVATPKMSSSASRSGLPPLAAPGNSTAPDSSFERLEIRDARGTEVRGVDGLTKVRRLRMGIMLIVGGLAMALLHSDLASLSAFAVSVGMLMTLFGVGILMSALREKHLQSKIQVLKLRHPGEPYLWDRAWDKEGANDKSDLVLRFWVITALHLAFAVPLSWAFILGGFPASGLTKLIGVAALTFDFLLLLRLLQSVGPIYKSIRLLRYGVSRVKFVHFPYALGEKVDLTLLEASRLQGCTKIEAKLRCVEERSVMESVNQRLVERIVPHQLYAETKVLKTVATNQDRIKLSFETPIDPRFTTDLNDNLPRYWELDIRAELPGVDYNSVFLLPIYAKSADRFRTKYKS